MSAINPLTAAAVVLATAATDAVYVMFTSAVVAKKRVPAATWSSIWYMLSSFAVISYTENWVYVGFAAIGSWIGAYASMTYPASASRKISGRRLAGIKAAPFVPRAPSFPINLLVRASQDCSHRSSLTTGADSHICSGGTPPPNGRLTIWKGRS